MNLRGAVVDATEHAVDAALLADHERRERWPCGRAGRGYGARTNTAPDHPFLTERAAQQLVELGAALVGIDSVNIDDTSAAAAGRRPVHSRLLAAGIPIVEHLRGLEDLGSDDFRFFAVPVKVRGMGTFPVRAFALLG